MKHKRHNNHTIELLINSKVETNEREALIHSLLKQKLADPDAAEKTFTFGQRIADKMAKVAGSWTFIIIFCAILIGWIALNILLMLRAFDPYPFILLNLALSCVAAIQAPIIMMSQNRQSENDRMQAENDYQVNIKSEIILEDLHEKIDTVIAGQEAIVKIVTQMMTERKKGLDRYTCAYKTYKMHLFTPYIKTGDILSCLYIFYFF